MLSKLCINIGIPALDPYARGLEESPVPSVVLLKVKRPSGDVYVR
jgi:hypothetical protein